MNNFEELNYQQQRFCDEYLVSFNAFRAALAAGYSENTARKAELLHNPKIQAYLKTGMEKARQRLEVTHDMILREFAKVAFSNMGNYYDERGAIKPMCCMTSEEKAAISYYQIMDSIDEHGNRVGEFGKIKLHNKMSALDKIARHVGFYAVVKPEASVELKAESEKPKAFEEQPEVGSLKQQAFVAGVEEEVCLVVNDEGKLAGETALEKAESTTVGGDDLVLEEVPAEVTKILTLSPPGRLVHSPVAAIQGGYDRRLC